MTTYIGTVWLGSNDEAFIRKLGIEHGTLNSNRLIGCTCSEEVLNKLKADKLWGVNGLSWSFNPASKYDVVGEDRRTAMAEISYPPLSGKRRRKN